MTTQHPMSAEYHEWQARQRPTAKGTIHSRWADHMADALDAMQARCDALLVDVEAALVRLESDPIPPQRVINILRDALDAERAHRKS